MESGGITGQYLDHYQIVEQLGTGGMATVYKAFDTRLERYVALKVILARIQSSEKYLRRFELEARVLAQLNHPNIVGIIDYGKDRSLPYLVMPYIPGGTLKERIRGPMLYQRASALLAPIAWALDYAHMHNILHRDVKPSNILFTESDRPMLTDFGIAKLLNMEQTMDLTETGFAFGSVEYMSPEQALNRKVDFRSDVYSLGIVYYELLTGRRPFRAETPAVVLHKQAFEPPSKPSEFVPGLPIEVEQAVMRALAKEPDDRFANMGQFAETLSSLGKIEKMRIQGEPFRSEHIEVTVPPVLDQDVIFPGYTQEDAPPIFGPFPSDVPAQEQPLPDYFQAGKAKRQVPWSRVGLWSFLIATFVLLCLIVSVVMRGFASGFDGTSLGIPTLSGENPFPQVVIPGINGQAAETQENPGAQAPGGGESTQGPLFSPVPADTGWQQGQLAFLVRRDRGNDLIQVDLDPLSNPVPVHQPSDNLFFMGADWSPDGGQIAYHQMGGRAWITSASNEGEPVTYGRCNSPSWAPDGQRFICKSNVENVFEVYDVESKELVDTYEINGNGVLPVWSPRGDTFAYSILEDGISTIWLMPFESRVPRLLMAGATENYAPSWSPDGEWIAYQSNQDSQQSEIWVMDKNGENARRITHTTEGYWSRGPTWSPDGRWLVYVSNQAGSFGNDYGELFVVNIESGYVYQLTDTGGMVYDWRVSWGPD